MSRLEGKVAIVTGAATGMGAEYAAQFVEQARLMAQRLRAVSAAPVVYGKLPGATHAFDTFGAPRATAAAEAVERFLGVAYGDWVRRGSTR